MYHTKDNIGSTRWPHPSSVRQSRTSSDDGMGDESIWLHSPPKVSRFLFSSIATLLYTPSITSVTIPSTVKAIGKYSFMDCLSLTSVTIPEGVVEIGAGAFSGCEALTEVSIPSTVNTVRYRAFGNCPALKTIRFYHPISTGLDIGQENLRKIGIIVKTL